MSGEKLTLRRKVVLQTDDVAAWYRCIEFVAGKEVETDQPVLKSEGAKWQELDEGDGLHGGYGRTVQDG